MQHFSPMGSAFRPPTLGLRCRRISPAVEQGLHSWIRQSSPLPERHRVDSWEWVSLDSRSAPHTVFIAVGEEHNRRLLVIPKASERIERAAVRAALSATPLGL